MSIVDHGPMLADKRRMEAYRQAIHALVKPGQLVCDLGCGSGILGFFALQAGAAHVYGIERDNVVESAPSLAQANGYGDKTTYFHADSNQIELPQKVDWIVFEWLSTIGADESPLDELHAFIQRNLKPEGGIIPRIVEHYVVPVQDAELWENRVGIWSENHYGLDLSSVRPLAALSPILCRSDPAGHLAEAGRWLVVDYLDPSTYRPVSRFEGDPVEVCIQKKGICHGLAIWFKSDLGGGVWLSNSPTDPETHWQNYFLPFENPYEVEQGDVLTVEVGNRQVGRRRELFWLVKHRRKKRTLIRMGSPGMLASTISLREASRITGQFIPEQDAHDRYLQIFLPLIDGKRSAHEVAGLAAEQHPEVFENADLALAELIRQWRERRLTPMLKDSDG